MLILNHIEEQTRLEFIETRDGRPAALEFAVRTYDTYKRIVLGAKKTKRASVATLMGHGSAYAHDPKFRRGFVQSCLSFREYIRKYRNTVT
jgi:hypothetical protein